MSEPKFTPRPWFRKGKMILHCAPEKGLPLDLPNGVVARCIGGPRDWEGLDEEANANASLIVTAPEMYDLLEEVCGDMDCALNGIETNLEKDRAIWTRTLQEDIYKIKLLLAKARVDAKQEEKK